MACHKPPPPNSVLLTQAQYLPEYRGQQILCHQEFPTHYSETGLHTLPPPMHSSTKDTTSWSQLTLSWGSSLSDAPSLHKRSKGQRPASAPEAAATVWTGMSCWQPQLGLDRTGLAVAYCSAPFQSSQTARLSSSFAWQPSSQLPSRLSLSAFRRRCHPQAGLVGCILRHDSPTIFRAVGNLNELLALCEQFHTFGQSFLGSLNDWCAAVPG